ncbi:hypothetical protein [Metabacillus fastidiosus]|uniref:hypothetical protein n=1 Tax=Metabacillus fastidiosus TaxID=1458 RepID=UPI003D2AB1C4
MTKYGEVKGKAYTKEEIRRYIRFEKAFGQSPWHGMVEDQTSTELYKRYKRIYCR